MFSGVVMAVDGKTGESLWNMSTYNEIFELNCGNIDINKDKKMDCLGAGRKGSFVAFDPRNGSLLWEPQTGGERYIEYAWNIYNPLGKDMIVMQGIRFLRRENEGFEDGKRSPNYPVSNK